MWWKRPAAAAALLIAIAVVRIASTYTTFSLTTDEPVHVGAGLELLQHHTYTLQPENPPLPRIVMAAPLSWSGVKWGSSADFFNTANAAYYTGGHYLTKLVLMRAGNLVFFVIAAIALFVWARRELGDAEAILATFLFTFQPIVLGYSGIANHDAAATAGLAVSLLAFSSWLRRPDAIRAAWLGAAYGFSILCKFSCIPYVPAACGLMFLAHAARERHLRKARAIATVLLVPLVAAVVIWAGYAFTVGRVANLVVPAPAFVRGVINLISLDKSGMFESYAFGRSTLQGWWWYFPVALGLKTTLPFLALLLIAGWYAWRTPAVRWIFLDGVLASLGILIIAMRSTLDLGVRYVLPVYVPLSLAAAAGAMVMLRDLRLDVRRIAFVLIALHAIVSAAAHPDYFPYFNALAGDDPGFYLIDSNLDWGQDALRLKNEAKKRHIDRIGLLLPGSVNYEAIGMPRPYSVDPFRPQRGWIAVGEHMYRIQHLQKGWWWLDPYRFTRVGKSVRLYYLPPSEVRFVEGSLDQFGPAERILLPIAGTITPVGQPNVAQWRVDQMIRNTGRKAIDVSLSHCANQCDFTLEPNQSMRVAGSDPIRPFIWVTVARDQGDDLEMTTVVRRVDRFIPGSDINVPAVRESEFRDGEIVIDNVPFTPKQRLNLRIYSATTGMTAQATVRVTSGANVIAETSVPIYSTGFYTHGDFTSLLPTVAKRDVTATVSIRADRRLWAFVTATEVDTGRTTVLLPRAEVP